MDASVETDRSRHALLWIALAPLIPQLLGSVFNIWYNAVAIHPLLGNGALRERFFQTVIIYNLVVYPAGVALWLWCLFSLRPVLRQLRDRRAVVPDQLEKARRRLIHLPWWVAIISAAAWLLCIPVFLISLAQIAGSLDARLLRHLPISFCVSAFIAVTNGFFLAELASHRTLFPLFFQDARPDLMPGVVTLSLRGRGILWVVSAAICPIVSLLLLEFAPPLQGSDPRWFAIYVAAVGIVFGLATALMISRLVAQPIDQLRAAAKSVAAGQLDVQLPVRRADEFGALVGEFNYMTQELKEKERLRQTFGLHVGERAAEEILARDPGLGGVEQDITAMFVDIRSFTARADRATPHETLEILNKFLRAAVEIVEGQHAGMINKYLGDGFMALFGIGTSLTNHAQDAFDAGRDILHALVKLNQDFVADGHRPIQIGIGIHSGPAIVGSIGSPQRLEFTAIGATVNLASRIENLTKQFGVSMLITADAAARLKTRADLIELPPQEVRGVEEPVKVFAPRTSDQGGALSKAPHQSPGGLETAAP
jgi:adenylate cyclase